MGWICEMIGRAIGWVTGFTWAWIDRVLDQRAETHLWTFDRWKWNKEKCWCCDEMFRPYPDSTDYCRGCQAQAVREHSIANRED